MSIKRFALPIALAAMLAVPAFAQDKAKKAEKADSPAKQEKLATVNGVAIPMARMEIVVKDRTQQGQPDNPEVRAAIRDQLITSEILSQEAGKKGLGKRVEIATQLDLARQQVMARAFVQDFVKSHQPAEADLRREYEAIKSQLGDKEYKARHILVDKVEEAKDAIAKLKKGDKFEDVAKAISKDPGSKERGGELDWTAPSGYVKPFSEAMVKLEKGKYTQEPVQTQFGFHVIQLDDTRELKVPSFDEVKPNITQRIQSQMLEKEIGELRKKAKVE
jgi:peptidyl-prolyl cis-trans isomerase C